MSERVIPFEKSFASHILKGCVWSKRNELKPSEVSRASHTKYYFDCTVCGHEYERQPKSAIKYNSCPYCAHKYLCSNLDCDMCHNNSFASHQKSKLWSSKNEGTPRDYFKSAVKKFLFNCDGCNHTYNMTLNDVSAGKECGYCYGDKLCENDDCKVCKEKSFASRPFANCWSDRNNKTARQTNKRSHVKALFYCNKCDHTFEKIVNNIMDDIGCPVCSHDCLCDDDCDDCFNKSFASIEQSKYWSDKNELKPRNYFKSSNTKCFFDCPDCNEIYEAKLSSVTLGYWCNCTINKTETKLFNWCIKIPNINIEHPKKFDWCKNKTYLPFDFCIESLKLIIELDGRQHFQQVPKWPSPEENEKTDRYKMKLANEHGYSIIRICQATVWSDKNNWKEKLKSAIKKYNKVTNVFIGTVYETAKITKSHKYPIVLVSDKVQTIKK